MSILKALEKLARLRIWLFLLTKFRRGNTKNQNSAAMAGMSHILNTLK